MTVAQSHAALRIRREAERKATEQEKRERARTAAQVKYLDKLAGREAQTWEQVDALVQTKQSTNYDRAVSR
jgi:flagellar motility protein MotE (MotC chaperone)